MLKIVCPFMKPNVKPGTLKMSVVRALLSMSLGIPTMANLGRLSSFQGGGRCPGTVVQVVHCSGAPGPHLFSSPSPVSQGSQKERTGIFNSHEVTQEPVAALLKPGSRAELQVRVGRPLIREGGTASSLHLPALEWGSANHSPQKGSCPLPVF